MGKKKRGLMKPTTKKKKKLERERETVNKKALFNRYKDKQKVQDEIAKKMRLDRELQKQHVAYSESEEEEDAYGQLVSCFTGKSKATAVVSESDSELSDEHLSASVEMELGSDMEADSDLETKPENEESSMSDRSGEENVEVWNFFRLS